VITVLIADDEQEIRSILGRLMAGEGHTCVFAADGAEAVRVATEIGPDLILMDVKMPRMTGLEALAALRRDARTRATPVILISAGTRLAAELSGLLATADDFVAKPFDPDMLLARVRAVLGRTRPAAE